MFPNFVLKPTDWTAAMSEDNPQHKKRLPRYHGRGQLSPKIAMIKGDNRRSQGTAPVVSIKEKSASLSRLFVRHSRIPRQYQQPS